MLDLALNCLSHWDDWIRLLSSQEAVGELSNSCEKMRGSSLMTHPCLLVMKLL